MKTKSFPLLLCSLVALVSIMGQCRMHEIQHGTFTGQVDFSPVYIATKLMLAGERASIYGNDPYGAHRDLKWMKEEQALPDGHYDTVFSYMPVYLIPILPFAYAFDYKSCVRVLTAINIALAALLCGYLALQNRFRFILQLLLAGLLAHAHVITETINLGQNMLIAGAFIYLFLRAVDRNQRGLAILFFLIVAVSKPWAFLFAGYALVRRDFKLVFYLGGSLGLLIAAQALWDPALFAGYLEITLAHSKIAVLAHNNIAFTAGIHRLMLDDWISYVGWFDAGSTPFFLLPLKMSLAALAVLVGFLSPHRGVKTRSVMVAVFVMLNVFWDFYLILFLPFFMQDLFPFSKKKIPLLLLGVASFFWRQIELYPFFHSYFYKYFAGGATGTIAATQMLIPSLLVIWLYFSALRAARENKHQNENELGDDTPPTDSGNSANQAHASG
ncbi:MAG: DUF2029 domain-containing protein [bacterium]|nr:DUF2029 domain-containing protein [bacterium]